MNQSLSTSLTLQILLPFKILLIIATVALNALIVYIIAFMLRKKGYSNLLFLSKSLADMIVGASSMPFMTVYTSYGYWPLGYGLCVFWVVFDFSSCCISIFTFTLLTWHRYRWLTKPNLINDELTAWRYFCVAVVWIIPFGYFTTTVLMITSQNFIENHCYFTYTLLYVLLTDLFAYVIPIGLLLILAGFTYKALRVKRRRQVSPILVKVINVDNTAVNTIVGIEASEKETIENNYQEKRKKKRNRRQNKIKKEQDSTILLISISISLALFWLIFIITWPIYAACKCVDAILYEIGYWFAYIYSTAYPLLLLRFHDGINKAFFKILKRVLFKTCSCCCYDE